MINWSGFLFEDTRPIILDGRDIPTDEDLAARNAQRVAEAKASLGDKWVCAKPVERRP